MANKRWMLILSGMLGSVLLSSAVEVDQIWSRVDMKGDGVSSEALRSVEASVGDLLVLVVVANNEVTFSLEMDSKKTTGAIALVKKEISTDGLTAGLHTYEVTSAGDFSPVVLKDVVPFAVSSLYLLKPSESGGAVRVISSAQDSTREQRALILDYGVMSRSSRGVVIEGGSSYGELSPPSYLLKNSVKSGQQNQRIIGFFPFAGTGEAFVSTYKLGEASSSGAWRATTAGMVFVDAEKGTRRDVSAIVPVEPKAVVAPQGSPAGPSPSGQSVELDPEEKSGGPVKGILIGLMFGVGVLALVVFLKKELAK